MIKAPINLQDLRRRLYIKAKAEPSWRFWGLYVHVCKPETLKEAYQLAKRNNGAPGIDGVTFEAIEAEGRIVISSWQLLGGSGRPGSYNNV
jgi:RNA-directed DNA polymerase